MGKFGVGGQGKISALALVLALAVGSVQAIAQLRAPEDVARLRLEQLPADAGAHYLTFFVEKPEQVAQIMAVYPKLGTVKQSCRFNVYLRDSDLYVARYSNVPVPSAVLQRPDGGVIWASTHFRRICPWRDDSPPTEPAPPVPPTPDPAPVIPFDETFDEPPLGETFNAFIPILLALLGGVAGAGSKIYDEFQSS